MKKTLMIAAAAASMMVPNLASAGDYLSMFESRPNKTIHFTPSAPAQMGTPTHHIQLEPYDAGQAPHSVAMQPHHAPQSHGTYSSQEMMHSAPSMHHAPAMHAAPVQTYNHEAAAPMHHAPAPKHESNCKGSSCTTFGYANSGKRYDIYGKRIR